MTGGVTREVGMLIWGALSVKVGGGVWVFTIGGNGTQSKSRRGVWGGWGLTG